MVINKEHMNKVLWEDMDRNSNLFSMGKYNNSHYFLLPLFGLHDLIFFKENYIGTYINDHGRTCYIDCPLFVAFAFDDLESDEFKKVDKYFSDINGFCFSYFFGTNNDDNVIVYVLKADSRIKRDYNNIIEGRYSYVSQRCRDLYKSFPFKQDVLDLLDCITLRDRWYKLQIEQYLDIKLDHVKELWSYFDPKNEILRYDPKKI